MLDIDTSIGDGAQLGHSSSLQRGQAFRTASAGTDRPAEPTTADYCKVPHCERRARSAALRSAEAVQLLLLFGPSSTAAVAPVPQLPASMSATTVRNSIGLLSPSAPRVTLFGCVALGLFAVTVVPRCFSLILTPGRTYPLYGFRYWLQTVSGFSRTRVC